MFDTAETLGGTTETIKQLADGPKDKKTSRITLLILRLAIRPVKTH